MDALMDDQTTIKSEWQQWISRTAREETALSLLISIPSLTQTLPNDIIRMIIAYGAGVRDIVALCHGRASSGSFPKEVMVLIPSSMKAATWTWRVLPIIPPRDEMVPMVSISCNDISIGSGTGSTMISKLNFVTGEWRSKFNAIAIRCLSWCCFTNDFRTATR
jgi:hypothetical protein